MTVSNIVFQVGFTTSYFGPSVVDLVIYSSNAQTHSTPANLLAITKAVNMSAYPTGSVWNCVPLTTPSSLAVSAGSTLFVGFYLPAAAPAQYPAYGVKKANSQGQKDFYVFDLPNAPNTFPSSFSTENSQVLIMGFSAGSTCSSLSSCSSCVPNSACAWCLSSQTCIADSQTPTCPSYTHDPKYCNKCGQFSTCRTCATGPGDCAWCEQPSSSSCVPKRNDGNCRTAITDPKYCDAN